MFVRFIHRDETELIGQDGHIYKGRMDDRPQVGINSCLFVVCLFVFACMITSDSCRMFITLISWKVSAARVTSFKNAH